MWDADLPDGLCPYWSTAPAVSGIVVGTTGWLPQPDWVQPSNPQGAPQRRFAAAFHGIGRWWWNGSALVPDGWCDINEQATRTN
jgi:hypothetical protein